MDIKILLALAAGVYFLTSRKASAGSLPMAPGSTVPVNSPSSEQALLDTLAPGSVPNVQNLTPITINSPTMPIAPSPPGQVVKDIVRELPGATRAEAWNCPDGQIPNPQALEFERRWAGSLVRPMIAIQRCLESSQAALDAGNVAPPLTVMPIDYAKKPGYVGLPTVCKTDFDEDGNLIRQCAY